jgi:hypothetical protein
MAFSTLVGRQLLPEHYRAKNCPKTGDFLPVSETGYKSQVARKGECDKMGTLTVDFEVVGDSVEVSQVVIVGQEHIPQWQVVQSVLVALGLDLATLRVNCFADGLKAYLDDNTEDAHFCGQ